MEKERVTGHELARRIAAAIDEDPNGTFTASIWTKKTGQTRVYVKRNGKDNGYICVTNDGSIDRRLYRESGTIGELYRTTVESLEVMPPVLPAFATLKSNDSLSSFVEECWECGTRFTTYGNLRAGGTCRLC